MLKVNGVKIPFFVSEIKFANFMDFMTTEATPENPFNDIDILTGVEFSKIPNFYKFGRDGKKQVADSLRKRVKEYKPQKIKNFVHGGELYVLKGLNEITVLEGVLALNFAKEFMKKKYETKGLFAMRLYLIATLSRRIENGRPEQLPVNLGAVHEFVENRVKEIENISFKTAMDFQTFFFEFENKLSTGFFQFAFRNIHPVNIKSVDTDARDRYKRFSAVFGSFSIIDHLIQNNLISSDSDGLKTPFFHSLFIYAININR